MQVRLGYVSQALEPGLTAAHTVSYSTYKKLEEDDAADPIYRLTEVARKNLEHSRRILYYNRAEGIYRYRLSTYMVPLATHPQVNWPWEKRLRTDLKRLGETVKKTGIRVSTHPSHFVQLASPDETVLENSLLDLQYQQKLFEGADITLPDGRMVVHVGGAYGDSGAAADRFVQRAGALPEKIRRRLLLENDETTYGVEQVLDISGRTGIPVVFDYHHHRVLTARDGGADSEDHEGMVETVADCLATWPEEEVPKVHLASPREGGSAAAHADYLDLPYARPFFRCLQQLGQDVDIMVEAKQKDLALKRLSQELAEDQGWHRVSTGVFRL